VDPFDGRVICHKHAKSDALHAAPDQKSPRDDHENAGLYQVARTGTFEVQRAC
jgi:hypothetical protein